MPDSLDRDSALAKLESAGEAGNLSAGAVENIRHWLTEPRYAKYAPEVIAHLADERWQELDDAFWTVIPFGTGGRRGKMYPIGSNAVNERTIGESALGLAEYVQQTQQGDLSCAIAYDTRHRSREFAELCAGIMVARGFKVYFLDDYRSTPELSYLVRLKGCSCGIMVTASHNPPSDNAVKVYWSTGGQLVPPHDKNVIDLVYQVNEIEIADFEESLAAGKIEICTEEVDKAYFEVVRQQSLGGPHDLKVIYSPLHGVGGSAVPEVLAAVGFNDVEVFGPHAEPSGDFPNVPGHVSNPENPAVFDAIIERAKEVGADIILATDPDADRMGCAAPLTSDTSGPWKTFTGNQLGALLNEFVLSKRSDLTPDHYVVKTIVTTEMIRRIADSYNVKTEGNLLVGFKWIGEKMDEAGPDRFVFGCEESHGYLIGQYARDKDGPVACLLMSELAAACKAEGQTLHEKLESLYWQYGYHAENLLNIFMKGSDGMKRTQALMAKFRSDPPASMGGLTVTRVRDYDSLTAFAPGEAAEPFEGPKGNLVVLELAEEGNYVAVRPSGTEPKVKFYMFTYRPAEQLHDLEAVAADMQERLAGFETDLQNFADTV